MTMTHEVGETRFSFLSTTVLLDGGWLDRPSASNLQYLCYIDLPKPPLSLDEVCLEFMILMHNITFLVCLSLDIAVEVPRLATLHNVELGVASYL